MQHQRSQATPSGAAATPPSRGGRVAAPKATRQQQIEQVRLARPGDRDGVWCGPLGKLCTSDCCASTRTRWYCMPDDHRRSVMGTQGTFAGLAWSQKGKVTRREQFLAEMYRVIPWTPLIALIAPYYPKAGLGRQPPGAREDAP